LNFDVFTRIFVAKEIISNIWHNRIGLGVVVSCRVYHICSINIHIRSLCMHITSHNIGVPWVANGLRHGTTLSMFRPNQVILHKTSANEMRNYLFCILKYNIIFAVDARTTSIRHDGSNLDMFV
jgi:hypothetical protein